MASIKQCVTWKVVPQPPLSASWDRCKDVRARLESPGTPRAEEIRLQENLGVQPGGEVLAKPAKETGA